MYSLTKRQTPKVGEMIMEYGMGVRAIIVFPSYRSESGALGHQRVNEIRSISALLLTGHRGCYGVNGKFFYFPRTRMTSSQRNQLWR